MTTKRMVCCNGGYHLTDECKVCPNGPNVAICIPKGGMCSTCEKQGEDCSDLPFHTYPTHKVFGDGYINVICREYVRDTNRQ